MPPVDWIGEKPDQFATRGTWCWRPGWRVEDGAGGGYGGRKPKYMGVGSAVVRLSPGSTQSRRQQHVWTSVMVTVTGLDVYCPVTPKGTAITQQ